MNIKNTAISILGIGVFLALGIISIFTFYCDANDSLKSGIIVAAIFSVIMFVILFIVEKNLLFNDQQSKLEIETAKKELTKVTYIDTLTNLPNRIKFFEDLPQAHGIILIDLDDFSLINTIYSKEVGDEFLTKLSHRLHSIDELELYRMGGDEFAMISRSEMELKHIGQKVLDIIDNFFIVKDNIMIQITATISISYTKPFIETADLALKYGKKNKLNLVIFSDNLNIFEENKTFIDVTMRIKKALKMNHVVPFYQGIVDKDGNIIKYEALMRIKDGEKYLLPAVFLDIAKKTKMYADLTVQMVTKTFEYMKNKDVPFSFNLSYDDIINKRIYNFILEQIDNFPKKENIIVELLESENVKNFDYVKHFIDEIHKRGAKVAIDDFGSGYSNFIYLEKLNVDIIKIEGEIVLKILSSPNAMFLVKTIVEFCQKNNIISIAEYVAHREIFLELKELGVNEFQGFHFSLPKESIE